MLFIAHNIRSSPPEALQPLEVERLWWWLTAADSPLATEVPRLQRVAQLDKKAFATAKLSLPYVIGASFEGGLRNLANFKAIDYLILDFDDCLQTPAQGRQLRERLQARPDVWLLFASPSGTGLKVWFRLQTPCTDAALFKAFYREVGLQLATDVNLLGTLDTSTSDVTRACFLSYDPLAFHNPNALPLNWEHWAAAQLPPAPPDPDDLLLPPKPPLSAEIYGDLLRKVNPKAPSRPKELPLVPPRLLELQAHIGQMLQQQGIGVAQIQPLQFGVKFCCVQQLKRAEVCVYYGKRGFSIVKTPKTGIDATLNDTVYTLLYDYLFENPDTPNLNL